MIYTLPDNTNIEVGYGSNLPPGTKGGQHVSRCYTWFRVNSGEWEQANSRTTHKLLQLIKNCETLADFRKVEIKEE